MNPEDLRPIDGLEEALKVPVPPRPALVRPEHVHDDVRPRYPLRGTPVEYRDPTEPVAEADWETPR